MGEGLLVVYLNFQQKKLIFITHIKPKHSEKNEIFSIFSNFGGQYWGLRGLRGHVPPKFKTKYMISFLVVFVTLTYLVFEKLSSTGSAERGKNNLLMTYEFYYIIIISPVDIIRIDLTQKSRSRRRFGQYF